MADANKGKVAVLWDIENEGIPRTLTLEKCKQILKNGVMLENNIFFSKDKRIRIYCGGKQGCTATMCFHQRLSPGGTLVSSEGRIFSTTIEGVDIACGWRSGSGDTVIAVTADALIAEQVKMFFQLNANVKLIVFTNDDKLRRLAKEIEVQNSYRHNKAIVHPKDVWDLELLADSR